VPRMRWIVDGLRYSRRQGSRPNAPLLQTSSKDFCASREIWSRVQASRRHPLIDHRAGLCPNCMPGNRSRACA
jgi:hypothetical protein